jgi:putative phosphoribosyl transferase
LNRTTFLVIASALIYRFQTIFGILAGQKLQIQFKDRSAAGALLGEVLIDRIRWLGGKAGSDMERDPPIVLGIPRGGVITALAVATKLSTKARLSPSLCMIISSRIVAPYNAELTIGAVTEDGQLYANDGLIKALDISQEYIDSEREKRLLEIQSRRRMYFDRCESIEYHIRGRTLILVDDGAASGATIIAALRFLKNLNPRFIIACVPVAPKNTVSRLLDEANEVVTIFTPDRSSFRSVGQYYADFDPISNGEVAKVFMNDRFNMF